MQPSHTPLRKACYYYEKTMPNWLNPVAIIALVIAIICAAIIAADILAGHRQHMGVMNVVWPITGLYAGPLALWAYFTSAGSRHSRDAAPRRSVASSPGGKAQAVLADRWGWPRRTAAAAARWATYLSKEW